MSCWLALADEAGTDTHTPPDNTTKPDKTPAVPTRAEFCQVLSGCQVGSATAARDDWKHGVAINGYPRTWTGKVVSLDAWRELSEWERHGPNGRVWNGISKSWEFPR